LVQIKQNSVYGVENPHPRSFLSGFRNCPSDSNLSVWPEKCPLPSTPFLSFFPSQQRRAATKCVCARLIERESLCVTLSRLPRHPLLETSALHSEAHITRERGTLGRLYIYLDWIHIHATGYTHCNTHTTHTATHTL